LDQAYHEGLAGSRNFGILNGHWCL